MGNSITVLENFLRKTSSSSSSVSDRARIFGSSRPSVGRDSGAVKSTCSSVIILQHETVSEGSDVRKDMI